MPPPNTPEEGLPDEQTPSATLRAESPATSCPFNYQTLEYVDQVDQELICPICREPFVSPVTTSCDHTFCHSCLLHAWSLSNTCPTDRKPISFGVDTSPAAKIVHNQLGNLRVRCPNSTTGCQHVLCRSEAEDHVDRHCPYTLVQCPARGCDKKITRTGAESKECLHEATPCKYCGKQVEKVDMQSHINHDCPKSHQSCPHCGLKFPRSVLEQHESRCDEAVVPCKHTGVGCVLKIRRKEAEDHEHGCPYALLEKLGAIVAEQRDQIAELERRDRERERRLKSLELQVMNSSYSDYPRPMRTANSVAADAIVDGLSPLADDAFRCVGSSSGVSPPYESRDQYLLALFESVDARMEMLQKNMSDLEGRQTVMLLNETLPVKEQLAEMRSQLGVQGMHVRWLMNFRLHERSRHISGAVNPGMGGDAAASGAGSGDHSENDARGGGRRLSDTLRENPPRL